MMEITGRLSNRVWHVVRSTSSQGERASRLIEPLSTTGKVFLWFFFFFNLTEIVKYKNV